MSATSDERKPNYIDQRLRNARRKTNQKLSLSPKPKSLQPRRRVQRTRNEISDLVNDVKKFEGDRFVEAPKHDNVKTKDQPIVFNQESTGYKRSNNQYGGFRLPGMGQQVSISKEVGVKSLKNKYDNSSNSGIPSRPQKPQRPPKRKLLRKPQDEIKKSPAAGVNKPPQRPPRRPTTKPRVSNVEVPPKRPPRRPERSNNTKFEPRTGRKGANKLGGIASMFENGGAFNKEVTKTTVVEDDVPKFENSFFADAKRRREKARKRREEQQKQRIKEEEAAEEERRRIAELENEGADEASEAEVVQVTTEYLQDLLEKFNNLNEGRNQQHQENEKLKQDLENLNLTSQKEKQTLESKVKNLEKTIQQVRTKNRQVTASLKKKEEELSLRIKKSQKENSERQKQIVQKTKRIKILEDKSIQSDEERKKLRIRIQEFEKQVRSLNSKNKEFVERVKKLESSSTSAQKRTNLEFRRERTKFEESVNNLRQSVKNRDEMIKCLVAEQKKSVNVNKKNNEEEKKEISTLKNENRKKTEQIERMKKTHQRVIKKMESGKLVKNSTTPVNNTPDEKNNILKRLEEEVENLRSSNTEKEEKIKLLELEMAKNNEEQIYDFLEDDTNYKLEFEKVKKKLTAIESERRKRMTIRMEDIDDDTQFNSGGRKGLERSPLLAQKEKEKKGGLFGLCF